MYNVLRSLVAILAAAFLASACGQKGPLYLPGDPSQIQTEIPAQSLPTAAEPAEESEEEDDDTSR